MKIKKYSSPSQEIKNLLFELVRTCQEADGTYRLPYLDNAYNFDPEMPAFFMADLTEKMVRNSKLSLTSKISEH